MAKKSKTNSKPQENLELRWQYMQANPFCEVSPWLCRRSFALGVRRQETATDPHHIMGSGKGRWDLTSNLIAISRAPHRLFHDDPKWVFDGRILCLWIKLGKNELCPDEFYKAWGCHLRGFLTSSEPVHAEIVPLVEELRRAFP